MIYSLLQNYYRQPPRVTPVEVAVADEHELHFYLYRTAQNDQIVVIEGLGAAQPLSYIEEKLEESTGLTVEGWFVRSALERANYRLANLDDLLNNEEDYIYRDDTDPTLSPPYALVSVH